MSPEITTSFTRKEALQALIVFAASAATGMAVYQETHALLTTPEFDYSKDPIFPTPQENLDYLELLVQPRPALLNETNGHASYLEAIIKNNPLVREVFCASFNLLLSRDDPHPSLSSFVIENIYLADFYLQTDPYYQQVKSQRQKLFIATGLAAFLLAGITNSHLSMETLDELNIKIPKHFTDSVEGIGIRHNLWLALPPTYPIEIPNYTSTSYYDYLFKLSGKDRTVHLLNHFFLAFQFIKLSIAGSQDSDRIPPIIFDFIANKGDVFEQSLALSEVVGKVWESKESYNNLIRFLKLKKLNMGWFDLAVSLDILANQYGAELAVTLVKHIIYNPSPDIVGLLETLLNNPNLTEPQRRIVTIHARNGLGQPIEQKILQPTTP